MMSTVQENELFASVLEAVDAPFCLLDGSMHIHHASAAWKKKYPQNHLLMLDHIGSVSANHFKTSFGSVLTSSQKMTVDVELSDGKARRWSLTAGVKSAWVICTDVSERRESAYDENRTEVSAQALDDESVEARLKKRDDYLSALLKVEQILLTFIMSPVTFSKILEILGTVSGAGRVSVIENEFATDGTMVSMKLIAHWRSEKMKHTSTLQLGQTLNYVHFPTIYEKISEGQVLNLPIDALTENEKRFFNSKYAQAILLLPILINGKPFGFIGMDRLIGDTPWDATEVDLLRSAASAISLNMERSLAMENLRSVNEGFQAMLDAIPGYVSWINSDMEYLGINNRLGRLLKVEPAAIVGKKVGYQSSAFGEFVKEFFESDATRDAMEMPLVDGTKEMQLLMIAQKYRQNNAAVFIGIDFSDRIKMDERLREQAMLLDVARDAFILIGKDDVVIYWNSGAEKLYGWSKSETFGRKITELIYRPEEVAAYYNIQDTLEKRGEWTGVLKQVHKSGKVIVVESQRTLIRSSDSTNNRTLIVNTDITERKELEEQVMRNQRVESIGMIASGIAHDMNNVLTPIMASIEMLRARASDEKMMKRLDTLDISAQRGKALMQQILSFARGQQNEKKNFDVRSILKDISQLIRQTFPKSIHIIDDVPSAASVVNGDATQLHQVLMNLVVNARDAMPNGGILRLALKNQLVDSYLAGQHVDATVGDYAALMVSDTGMGIKSELLNRIFDPFFTTKDIGHGTGLGLSTVLSIVRAHGGFIDVESQLNRGTGFTIYLPLQENMGDDDATGKLQSGSLHGQGELILIVDDEEAILEIVEEVLENSGYAVLKALNGLQALEVFRQHQTEIRVVVTDMMMPVMDGAALIKALRAESPTIKVIATSGFLDTDKLAKHAEISENFFLHKPFSSEALLIKIREAFA
jgi:two-component system, cell cycle sensor histidine kinase and response regulator CckA